MNSVSKLLEKFKNILKSGTEARSIVIATIKNILGYEVQERNIKIKDGIIFVQGNPSLRNELFLNKDILLKETNKLLPENKKVKDIR